MFHEELKQTYYFLLCHLKADKLMQLPNLMLKVLLLTAALVITEKKNKGPVFLLYNSRISGKLNAAGTWLVLTGGEQICYHR